MAYHKSICDFLFFTKKVQMALVRTDYTQYKEAAVSYEKFKQEWEGYLRDKDRAEIIESLAYCWYNLSDYEQSLIMIQELVDNLGHKRDPNSWYMMYSVLKKLNRHTDSLISLQGCIRNNTKHTRAWFKLGKYYFKNTQWTLAKICLTRCKALILENYGRDLSDNTSPGHRKFFVVVSDLLSTCECKEDGHDERSFSEFELDFLLRSQWKDVPQDDLTFRDPGTL
eukprot:TRINITY_DN11738_c0_g2_i1.p1 TRINITY_DN11738_c0_g2~~TRINITY_DN11738_c0_g2_i1.p1  ORF type:complete len:225 (-),score=35.58 TRINITY_DN11738_c0_g2_i1:74-748(-)